MDFTQKTVWNLGQNTSYEKCVTPEEGGPDRSQAGIQITLIQVRDAPQ